MSLDAKQDVASQAWQVLPSLAAVIAWLAGLTVEKWLGLFGLAFLALQMAGYAWRWKRDVRRERERMRASAMAQYESGKGDL